MGNEQKRLQRSELRDYERFGTVEIKEDKQKIGRQNIPISTMIFQKTLDSEKTFKQWEQLINRVNDSQTQQIILLPLQKSFEKVGFCGSSGVVHLQYENFPYTLDSEIKNRRKMRRLFAQTEIWYLLYNMIRAANKFQKMNKKIGDINPLNVVINDDGQIRIIGLCSLPEEVDNYQKIIQNYHAPVFLAPEEINQEYIKKGQYPPVNPCKAEVFSIGLTILSAGILEDCFSLYDLPSSINEIKINEYLRKLKGTYSPYFFSTICSLLIFPPNDRKKASDVYAQLCEHEDEILELLPFEVGPKNGQIHQRQTVESNPMYDGFHRQTRHEIPRY